MAERPEACAAWREDLAAWLVAQIAPDREAALEEHLATCAACRAEADSLVAVAAVSLATDPDRASATAPRVDDDLPPADLGARISARIAAERRGGALRRGALVALGCAAAAVVLVVGIVVASGGGDDLEPIEGDEYAFEVGTGEATVAADPETGGSIVDLRAAQLDPELTYALWLAVPGGGRDERVPAGTFQPEDDGTVDVRLQSAMPADQAGRVWVTTPDFQLALDTEPPSPDTPVAEPWG